MGRPSLGKSARVVTGATKISRVEERALIEQFGTVHKGLRVAIDRLWQLPPGESLATAVSTAREDAGRCRIHPGWAEQTRWYDQGTEMVRKRCTECGFETVERAR